MPFAARSAQLTGGNIVLLALEAGAVSPGQPITVTYDLRDTHGRALRGTARVTTR